MKTKIVNPAVPYDMLNFYLSYKTELNILYHQYNFPHRYYIEDKIISFYANDVDEIKTKVSEKINDNFEFEDINVLSTDIFINAMISVLEEKLNQKITGYRLAGNNILVMLSKTLYRIDVFIKNPNTKKTELFTGLFGDNVFEDTENSINFSVTKIEKIPKTHKHFEE